MSKFLLAASVVASASGAVLKAENGELIPNEYIVMLKANVTQSAHLAQLPKHAEVMHTYSLINGYSMKVDAVTAETLSEHPDVEYMEQNQVARALQSGECIEVASPGAGLWGLRRVSTRARNDASPLRYGADQGADIYIMDTGIRRTHVDFGNRVTAECFSAFASGNDAICNLDGNGHGTHCAGTAAGNTYGISKRASLTDVKVLGANGSGTFAGVIAGINWGGNRRGNRVGSLSLGGGFSAAVNDAVNAAARNGMVLSIASGNSNANACNFSPASAAGGIGVNAMTNTDARSGFSNFGTCTDIFAPGSTVLSAWSTSDTATNTISGTSMACPHVTGIASDLWGRRPNFDNNAIKAQVLALAVPDTVTNPGAGSPNLLAQTDCAAV